MSKSWRMAGGPRTVTVTEQFVELPDKSVATKATSAVPIANVLPEAILGTTTGCGSQLSVAVGATNSTTAPLVLVASARIGAGQDISVGRVTSTLNNSTTLTPWPASSTKVLS